MVVHRGPAGGRAYGPLESEDGTRRFEIEALRPAKDHFVARLAGVADRNAAEKLTNIKLYVPRDRLPPIEDDDTFYHADLIGLAAVTPDGAALGTVTAVHNFGAGDIIEIAPADGGDAAAAAVHRRGGAGRWTSQARRIVVVPPTVLEPSDRPMWRATVLTIFPEMFPGPLGVEPRRQGAGRGPLVARRRTTSAAHATDRHRTVDDTPAGGGPGMVMKADVLARAIDARAGATAARAC